MGAWFSMSGINYYKRMKELYEQMKDNGDEGVRKTHFLNLFIRDQGLNLKTGIRKFNEASEIGVIKFLGRDKEGYEMVKVN